MRRHAQRNARIKLIAATAGMTTLALLVGANALTASLLQAQAQAQAGQTPVAGAAPVPQWQVDAGGKMALDVVSVKPNVVEPSATTVTANMAMGPSS